MYEELNKGDYLITFLNDWKYKSFIHDNDYILLDINDKIFKIPIKKVRKMILLKEHKPINHVMNCLKTNPENIWNEWDDDNEIKATLLIIQKGAGNGKTYGIWKDVSLNFDKETYIITTKQHTAKEVIVQELNAQAKRHEFHGIDNIGEYTSDDLWHDDPEHKRQYVIRYKHKHSSRVCIIIIGILIHLLIV